MRHVCVTTLALAVAQWCFAQSGQVAGSIVDARGGEALAKIDVQLAGTAYRTRSDAQGHFQVAGIPPGDYVLNVSTVGYRLAKKPFHLDAGETKQFDVILSKPRRHP
jgi:outer membrane receptor for ferrienterochelin and colicins